MATLCATKQRHRRRRPTMTATRYIIALCPAVRLYLAGNLDIKGSVTPDKSKAIVYGTYAAASKVADGITGWGGAQRVEVIEVAGTASLATAPPPPRTSTASISASA